MTRVRIICLAPTRNWVRIKENNDLIQNLLKINRHSKSWASTSGIKGARYGIHKPLFVLEDEKFVIIPFVWEKIVDSNYTSLETLIEPDTRDKTKYEHQIKPIQSELIFDVENGICYAIDIEIYQTPYEKLSEFFKKVAIDTKISISEIRQFPCKSILGSIEPFAKKDNFTSYVERGRTHKNRISRKGDEQDIEFLDLKNKASDGGWTTYTYLHNDPDDKWTFSLRGDSISISNSDDNKDRHVLLTRILRVRSLFEKTIGKTVSEYCFSDYR